MKKEKRMDFKKAIPEIEKKIGYTFKDKSLLTQAFTRTSYCNEANQRGEDRMSNEVLEFFGDSVLSLCIVTLLMDGKSERYEHGLHTEWTEGDFSNIRSKLSDKKNLSASTERLGLHEYLLMGEGDRKLGIADEPSVKEDLFESIIGAIYIDSDRDVRRVMGVVRKILNLSEYQKSDTPPIQSYKNALQEWCADKLRRLGTPIYRTISEDGPDHKKSYKRGCYIGEKLVGVGEGKNLKTADSEAARAALEELMTKSVKEEAKSAGADTSYATKLREYAAKCKKAGPTYKDLGESEISTNIKPDFRIECVFDIYRAIGHGASKPAAKSDAVRQVLGQINDAERKEPRQKRGAAPAPKRRIYRKK